MKNIIIIALLGFSIGSIQAQIVTNKGVTLTIKGGTDIYIKGDFDQVTGTTDNDGTIHITGDWDNSGTEDVDGTVRFEGSASNQDIEGDTDFETLEIDNGSGVTITGTGTADVWSDLQLESGVLTTNGNLKMLSDAVQSGIIDDFSSGNTGSLSGLMTAEIFLATIGYHNIGTAVSGATTADWLADFPLGALNGAVDNSQFLPNAGCSAAGVGSPFANLWYFDESTVVSCNLEGWHVEAAGGLIPGLGYSANVAAGTNTDLSGTMHTGSIAGPSVTNTNAVGLGWNLLCNPYQTVFNWDTFRDDYSTVFDASAQIWVPSGKYSGTYQPMVDLPTYNPYAMPGQAFFARKSSLGTSAITFENTHRSPALAKTADIRAYKTGLGDEEFFTLDIESASFADKTAVFFNPNATVHYDADHDCYKLSSATGQPTLASLCDGERLAINTFPDMHSVQSLPLYLDITVNDSYTFTFDHLSSLPASAIVFLEDKKLNVWQDVMIDPDYTVQIDPADGTDRFEIHFIPPVEAITSPVGCSGEAGTIQFDLGTYTIDGGIFTYDHYEVMDSEGNILGSASNASGLVDLQVSHAGIVTLELDINGRIVTLDIEVEALPQVIADFSVSVNTADVDEVINFENLSTMADHWTWDLADGNTIQDQTAVDHSYSSPGLYKVRLTASNDECEDESAEIIWINEKTTSIDQVDLYGLDITAFDNAARVSTDVYMPDMQIQIFDAQGRLVYNEAPTSLVTTIDMSFLAAGVYMIRAGNESQKEVKEVFVSAH